MEIIITILAFFGNYAWFLIFWFLRQKSPKCTYDIVKMITIAAIILCAVSLWVLSVTVVEKVNLGLQATKFIIYQAYLFDSQSMNTVTLFNIYSFVFEHREPKIDPNIPHCLTIILGILGPLLMTITTAYMDKLVNFSNKFDLVEYATGIPDDGYVLFYGYIWGRIWDALEMLLGFIGIMH